MAIQHRTTASRFALLILSALVAVAASGIKADVPTTVPGAAEKAGKIRGEKSALDAIRKGVAYLLAQQKEDNWERQPTRNGITHTGGETALVAWTLLHVGECLDETALRPDSVKIANAMNWLIKIEPKTTYVAAVQALAFSKLNLISNEDAAKAAERCRKYLIGAMRDDGGYSYTAVNKKESQPDNANSATAIQALAALQQEGLESAATVWNTADEYWHNHQHKDGGWSYDEGARKGSSPGMTAAAVATLHSIAAFRQPRVPTTAPGAERKPEPAEIGRDIALVNGLTYLGGEFNPESKDYYFLYHLQRAMGGAGIWSLAKKEVIGATAEAIAKAQRPDGSWASQFADPSIAGDQELVSTCYALLTLAAGFQPVAFSKLQYEGSGWDARPRDVANLTMWMSSKLSRPMRWQIVSGDTPNIDDFASPILFITGAKDFTLTDAMVARLRTFIHAGGMIVSLDETPAPDTDKPPAASDFTKAITTHIARQVIDCPFRELPSTHPISDLWGKVTLDSPLLAASNGVREVWVHIPADVSGSWQKRNMSEKEHFMLALNIYSYATGKGEMLTLEIPSPSPTTATAPATNMRTVSIARIMTGPCADPEPGAWPRFARQSEKQFHTQLAITNVKPVDLDAAKYPMAHWCGSGKVTLAEADAAKLRAYVDAGGLLVIEAAGGDLEFSHSVQTALATLLPKDKLETIPRNDLLYNGAMTDSIKIPEVTYRRYAAETRPVELTPRLKGISRGGRWAVIFSDDDITAGLLGLSTWGISGYSIRDAQHLAQNMALYSLKPIVGP